jgi:hypothetical protein
MMLKYTDDDQRGIFKTTHETTLTRREITKDVGEGRSEEARRSQA